MKLFKYLSSRLDKLLTSSHNEEDSVVEVPLFVVEITDRHGFNERTYLQIQQRILLKEPDHFELRQPDSLTLYYSPEKQGERRANSAVEELKLLKQSNVDYVDTEYKLLNDMVAVVLDKSGYIVKVVYRRSILDAVKKRYNENPTSTSA